MSNVPVQVLNSFDNLTDILTEISDDGLDELNFHKDETKITKLGVITTLKNRDGKDFKVIVCPDTYDMPEIRDTIMQMGVSIASGDGYSAFKTSQ